MSTAEIKIYGVIGTAEGQISHQDIDEQLALIGQVENLVIRINSKGGDVWEALGIYSSLNQYKATKIVFIDGIALSCASWIACVGDEINIAENGMYMYHEGRLAPGHSTVDELVKHSVTLNTLNSQMAETYAARTGIPQSEIAAGMKATTWLRAKDAVARKFATKLIPNKAVVALGDFAAFENVPDWVQGELTTATPENVDMSDLVIAPLNPLVTPASAVEPQATTIATAPAGVVVNVGGSNAIPVATVVDVVAVENSARVKERTRVREITATCTLAGCPEAANEFIDKDVSAQDVKNRMFDVLVASRPPVGPNGHGPTNEGTVPDATAKYEAEYEANKDMITAGGVTKERYILTRKEQAAKK